MKKLLSIVSFIMCCVLSLNYMAVNVYAGELDKNEKYILESLSDDKFPVKIEQQYINQLKNYFCQDDVKIAKADAKNFIEYFKDAMASKKDLEKDKSIKKSSDTCIQFEKAGTAIGLLLSYDSKVNDFYLIDQSGYIVMDFQDIIKVTGNASEGILYLVFLAIVAFSIIGIFGNLVIKVRRRHRRHDDDDDEDELEVAKKRRRSSGEKIFSHRNVMQILRYCFIPIIMVLILFIVSFSFFMPFRNIVNSVKNSFINTQPVFVENSRKFTPIHVDETKQKKSLSLSKITTPRYGEQYAEISCEELELSAPVFFGDTGNILQKGAGQYNGSFLPGEGGTILIGAHDTTYFKKLENVKKGNKFKVSTEYGIYQYEVQKIKIYDEGEYDKAYDLSAKKEQLILYTCYPFGELKGTKTQRMFVYLDKISGPNIKY